MNLTDTRTAAQHTTHTVLVVGTDPGLSGWGKAEGGRSYAAWACTPEDAPRVLGWARARGDLRRVRVVRGPWRPQGVGHAHVYLVGPGHVALDHPLRSDGLTYLDGTPVRR